MRAHEGKWRKRKARSRGKARALLMRFPLDVRPSIPNVALPIYYMYHKMYINPLIHYSMVSSLPLISTTTPSPLPATFSQTSAPRPPPAPTRAPMSHICLCVVPRPANRFAFSRGHRPPRVPYPTNPPPSPPPPPGRPHPGETPPPPAPSPVVSRPPAPSCRRPIPTAHPPSKPCVTSSPAPPPPSPPTLLTALATANHRSTSPSPPHSTRVPAAWPHVATSPRPP